MTFNDIVIVSHPSPKDPQINEDVDQTILWYNATMVLLEQVRFCNVPTDRLSPHLRYLRVFRRRMRDNYYIIEGHRQLWLALCLLQFHCLEFNLLINYEHLGRYSLIDILRRLALEREGLVD